MGNNGIPFCFHHLNPIFFWVNKAKINNEREKKVKINNLKEAIDLGVISKELR
jgi:hypothetical protein